MSEVKDMFNVVSFEIKRELGELVRIVH